jgi:hypothetical protein
MVYINFTLFFTVLVQFGYKSVEQMSIRTYLVMASFVKICTVKDFAWRRQ